MVMHGNSKSVSVKGILFTQKDIEHWYRVYQANVIELAKHARLGEFKAGDYPTTEIHVDEYNPYIAEKSFLTPLGRSLDAFGTYWMFLSHNDCITEGGHRYNALCHVKSKRMFPALNTQYMDWKYIKVRYPQARKFEHIAAYGFRTLTRYCNDANEYIDKFMTIPLFLRHVMHAWEKKYGMYPTAKLCNSIDTLKVLLLEEYDFQKEMILRKMYHVAGIHDIKMGCVLLDNAVLKKVMPELLKEGLVNTVLDEPIDMYARLSRQGEEFLFKWKEI